MPPTKRKTLYIRSEAFAGRDDLGWQDLEALRVTNVRDAADKLVDNWSGGVIGVPIFELNNDRRKVDNVSFKLFGTLFDDNAKVVASNKAFPNSNAKLTLSDLNCELFVFENSLTSNLVDSSVLNASFRASTGGPILTETELTERGIGPFSIRAHVYPTTATSVRLDIAIFPLPAAELKASFPLATDARFPALQLCTVGDIRVCPDQEDILGERSWGQPLLMAILSDSPFTESSALPPSSLLRKAFSSLMASGTRPTFKKDHKFLTELWTQVRNEGQNVLKTQPLELNWPPLNPIIPQQGRHNCFSSFFFALVFEF